MLKRMLGVLVCVLVVPACGGDSSSSTVPSIPDFPIPPGPGPITLVSDDWSSGSPSPNWVIVSGPATVDNAVGAPPGSMKVGSTTASGEVRSYYKFNTANSLGGITIQMDAAYLSESPSIKIYDADQLPPSASPVAIAVLFDGAVVYRIGSTIIQQNVVNDGNWHSFTLQIGGGTGTWKRDGVTQLTAPVTVGWAMIYISSGLDVSVWIDNVIVTAP
jgi:hypothetical protein